MSSRSILKVPEPPPVVVKAKVGPVDQDRKSTRLNSSHDQISYAVFCLKKKKKHNDTQQKWKNKQINCCHLRICSVIVRARKRASDSIVRLSTNKDLN